MRLPNHIVSLVNRPASLFDFECGCAYKPFRNYGMREIH